MLYIEYIIITSTVSIYIYLSHGLKCFLASVKYDKIVDDMYVQYSM